MSDLVLEEPPNDRRIHDNNLQGASGPVDSPTQPTAHPPVERPPLNNDQVGLLELLISEHRNRAQNLRDELSSIQTRVGATITAGLAIAALVVPQLPYSKLGHVGIAGLVLAGGGLVWALGTWVDALAGSLKSVFKPFQERILEAQSRYEEAVEGLDPIGVRVALLQRL